MTSKQENEIMTGLISLGLVTNDMSRAKGFWTPPPLYENLIKLMQQNNAANDFSPEDFKLLESRFDRNDGEALMLMVSELAEALEAFRNDPDKPSEHIPEFSAVEEELADVIIRVCEFARGRNLGLASAVLAKIKFNESRPHKHGKNF